MLFLLVVAFWFRHFIDFNKDIKVFVIGNEKILSKLFVKFRPKTPINFE